MFVADAPTVTIDEALIHTGPGQEVDIKCKFSANPSVTVAWKHNDSDIDFGFRSNLRSNMHREPGLDTWTIKIFDMLPSDFGQYKCVGANSKGSAEASVDVSGVFWCLPGHD